MDWEEHGVGDKNKNDYPRWLVFRSYIAASHNVMHQQKIGTPFKPFDA